MEITKDNLGQAILALRQCSNEHRNDNTSTFNIRVSDLCDDVANYLEKLQGCVTIDWPNEEDVENKVKRMYPEFYCDQTGHMETPDEILGFYGCLEWLESKIK